jgi:hypothetical protein
MGVLRTKATAAVLLVIALSPANIQGQLDQRAIAQQLVSQDPAERRRALDGAQTIGAQNIGPELRAALIALLEDKNRIVVEAMRRRVPLDTVDDPEYIATLSRLVGDLRDPKAIPALALAIYGGTSVMRALADFGSAAVPDLVRVAASPDIHYDVVNHCLITLRFMVERQQNKPLTAEAIDQIRRVTEYRLTGAQYFTTLWRAIDLAVVLNEPALNRTVSSLAYDPKQVIARGIENPDIVQRTQQLASDRLSGVPAVPRPPK